MRMTRPQTAVLDLIANFHNDSEPVTVQRVAYLARMPKVTAARILEALARRGLLHAEYSWADPKQLLGYTLTRRGLDDANTRRGPFTRLTFLGRQP